MILHKPRKLGEQGGLGGRGGWLSQGSITTRGEACDNPILSSRLCPWLYSFMKTLNHYNLSPDKKFSYLKFPISTKL